MSNLPPGYIEPDGEDYDDWIECSNCGGEGGYPICGEDSCPSFYGEEGCDDPACWCRCSECHGEGGWPAPNPEGDHS